MRIRGRQCHDAVVKACLLESPAPVEQNPLRFTDVPDPVPGPGEVPQFYHLGSDGILGREVCKADDAVDSLLNSVFRILLTHMMADARTINPSLELLLVGRNLERIADLATNIGEDAVFLAEGKQIKHRYEEYEKERLAAGVSPPY